RQSDFPGGFVADTKLQRLGLTARNHLFRLRNDLRLDASPRDRAEEVTVAVDRELASDRQRRRAPASNSGCKGNGPAPGEPAKRACQHQGLAHTRPFIRLRKATRPPDHW